VAILTKPTDLKYNLRIIQKLYVTCFPGSRQPPEPVRFLALQHCMLCSPLSVSSNHSPSRLRFMRARSRARLHAIVSMSPPAAAPQRVPRTPSLPCPARPQAPAVDEDPASCSASARPPRHPRSICCAWPLRQACPSGNAASQQPLVSHLVVDGQRARKVLCRTACKPGRFLMNLIWMSLERSVSVSRPSAHPSDGGQVPLLCVLSAGG